MIINKLFLNLVASPLEFGLFLVYLLKEAKKRDLIHDHTGRDDRTLNGRRSETEKDADDSLRRKKKKSRLLDK